MIDPKTQVLRCFLGRVAHEKKRKMYRLVGYIVIGLALSISALAAWQISRGDMPFISLGVGGLLLGSWGIHKIRIWRIRRAVFKSG